MTQTFKVQIKDDVILQDGVEVGIVTGFGGEWYIYAGTDYRTRKVLARFKHMQPGAAAKLWVKHVFARHTVEEIVKGVAHPCSPLEFAERTGYELPHITKWRKEGKLPASYDEARQRRGERAA